MKRWLVPACATAFLGAAAYVAWRIAFNAAAEVAIVLALAWPILLVATVIAVSPRLRKRRVVTKIVAVALTFLLVLELGLRAAESASAVSYLPWQPNIVIRFHPAPGLMHGIDYTESRFSTSSAGLRARELTRDDQTRILVIGGSTTELSYVDDEDAWPRVIEDELTRRSGKRVWVGNSGKSGLDVAYHAVLLRTLGAELRPEITVVLLGATDITHGPSGIDWDRGMQQYQMVRNSPLVVDGGFHWTGIETFWELRQLGQTVRRATGGPNQLVVNDAGRLYDGLRAQRQRAAKSDQRPADFDAALASYLGRVRAMIAASRAYPTTLVLLTHPSLYKPVMSAEEEAAMWGGQSSTGPDLYYTARAMADMLREYNAALLRVCAEERIACFDLASRVPADLDHFYDDFHFNTEGSRLVGRLVAEFLADLRR